MPPISLPKTLNKIDTPQDKSMPPHDKPRRADPFIPLQRNRRQRARSNNAMRIQTEVEMTFFISAGSPE